MYLPKTFTFGSRQNSGEKIPSWPQKLRCSVWHIPFPRKTLFYLNQSLSVSYKYGYMIQLEQGRSIPEEAKLHPAMARATNLWWIRVSALWHHRYGGKSIWFQNIQAIPSRSADITTEWILLVWNLSVVYVYGVQVPCLQAESDFGTVHKFL